MQGTPFKIIPALAIVLAATLNLAHAGGHESAVEPKPAAPTLNPLTGIDTGAQLGRYLGFGMGIHPGDVIYPEAFDALDLEYVRMELGPVWHDVPEKIPAGASVPELIEFIERNYNQDAPDRLEGARHSHAFLRERGIRIILIHFELPYHWRAKDGSGAFRSEHIEDLARFYTAHLLFLQAHGVRIDYIELANEPDGRWNGLLTPEDYARLLRLSRRLFDEHGLESVKILGPGLAFLNLYGKTPAYLKAIGSEGSDALHGWSTHTWDEVEFLHSKPEYSYGVWQPFLDGITALDPERAKPLFVTEYGSDVTHHGGVAHPSPRQQVAETVVDTWDYAVRVMANTISHLNRGANALVLYRFSNAHWHDTGWGIIQPETSEAFRPKPVFNVIREFLADLPVGASVLSPTWYSKEDEALYTILLDESNREMTLLMVNWTQDTQMEVIHFADLLDLKLRQAKGRTKTARFEPELNFIETNERSVFSVELPPRSILQLRFSFTQSFSL